MSKIHIGTSGWSYPHWQEIFYPADLKKEEWLKFYSQHFDCVELNTSFYHLPHPKSIQTWIGETPGNFLFAVKASRFITHVKRLKDPQESLSKFLARILLFEEKLGPILFQLPPGLHKETERLQNFLKELRSPNNVAAAADKNGKMRFAFEFRHESWFCDEIYGLLKKFNAALVFSDTPHYPYCEEIIADFTYLRLHGHLKLYASSYTQKQLESYAQKIKNWSQSGFSVWVFFDNDAQGYAVKNAFEFHRLVKR